ncbi:MAG TPA: YcxB family protein [Dinghuibacter sp.]|uniref:YcxB family protein n=1 Tax=Dinghuibacter sp. TaxID=2024697 RepID=UPI002C0C641F|nr:YcxB family protein [Dinghuibacter sp.]HTJ11992.1 YcxB family protein [Dinghuibacter sp.]
MSFSINAHLTKSEFVRMSVLRIYTNPIILFFCCVGVAALGFGLLEAFGAIPRIGDVYPTLFIGFFFAIAFPLFNAWFAARTYRYGNLSSQQVVYTFTDEGVWLNVATEMLPWEGLVRKQRVGGYLLLFTDRVSAFILPLAPFTPEQIDFVSAHVPKGRV